MHILKMKKIKFAIFSHEWENFEIFQKVKFWEFFWQLNNFHNFLPYNWLINGILFLQIGEFSRIFLLRPIGETWRICFLDIILQMFSATDQLISRYFFFEELMDFQIYLHDLQMNLMSFFFFFPCSRWRNFRNFFYDWRILLLFFS